MKDETLSSLLLWQALQAHHWDRAAEIVSEVGPVVVRDTFTLPDHVQSEMDKRGVDVTYSTEFQDDWARFARKDTK